MPHMMAASTRGANGSIPRHTTMRATGEKKKSKVERACGNHINDTRRAFGAHIPIPKTAFSLKVP